MYLLVYFALVYSSTAFFIKDEQTADIGIPYNQFNDSLSAFDVELEAADCKCENGRCVRDNRGNWKCLCKPRYALTEDFKCALCDCGNNGKCFFNEKVGSGHTVYEKKCLCDKDFAEKGGKCISCICGRKNSKCEFEDGEKVCYCEEGFAELQGVCEECNCGEGGVCEFKDDKKHCTCHEGFLLNGERCEECDCGAKGTCSFVNGKRTCACEDKYLENFGVCEECYCGEKSTMCKFNEEGAKECQCEEKHSQNEEGICAECMCGEKTETCQFGENNKKLCTCQAGFAPNNEFCTECNCGEHSSGCTFEGGRKTCFCESNYAQNSEGICALTCNADEECAHGGSCRGEGSSKFCDCKNGISGPNCEIIDDCKANGKYKDCKGENGMCEYDELKEEAVCKCTGNKKLHPLENICRECECGERSTGCAFGAKGNKVCSCKEKDAQNAAGICADCSCGVMTASCSFGDNDQKQCHCQDGFAVNNEGICTETCIKDEECRHGGSCRGEGNAKFCECKPGTSGVKCEIIDDCGANGKYKDCKGDNGNCVYDQEKQVAVCTCRENMKLHPLKNICLDCNCGELSMGCAFNEEGNKKCSCKETNAQNAAGICADCSCGVNTNSCSFGAHDQKQCNCKDGFAVDKRGICTETCKDNSECFYESTCEGKEDKFCKCKKGLLGDKCEIISDCTPDGKHANCKGEMGECGYDVTEEKAVCRCPPGKKLNPVLKGCEVCMCGDNEVCEFTESGVKKCSCRPGFAFKDNICVETCRQDSDCQHGGVCKGEGDAKFCVCKNGVSGPKCDVIDECLEIGKYSNCHGDNAICDYDVAKEVAVCNCMGNTRLNPVNNTCEVCNCGENTKHCEFSEEGKMKCTCKSGFSLKNDICTECNCGDKSKDCMFRDGKKVCQCVDGYLQRDEYCEECDCGKDALNCSFVEKQKRCSCADPFIEEDGKCIKKDPCEHNLCVNGRCVPKGKDFLCECQPPFTGRYCEINTCITTTCNGGRCKMVGGQEKCICPHGQRAVNGHCKFVKCRRDTCFGGRCEMQYGELVCVCPAGYHLEGIGCFAIVCVHHKCYGGHCVVLDDHELCTCPEGYKLNNDVCEKILCRKKACYGGTCAVIKDEEVCTCPSGFEIRGDVCELKNECALEQ